MGKPNTACVGAGHTSNLRVGSGTHCTSRTSTCIRIGVLRGAYHGTTSQNLPSILLQGLQNPGEPGVSILHGQSYSQTKRTIYLSPSIEYAAFPVYAQLFSLAEASYWGQLVLQCRVRPDSFIERPGSLGNKYWPEHVRFDPNFNSLG